MFDWISTFSAWMQGWLSAEAGLWGLFLSAFLSATVLPGSSEVVISGLITAYPALAWSAFFVALAGNVSGAVLTFGMGIAARGGYERFQRLKVDTESKQVQRLRRWGPPALFLSFVPLVGDALVLAAGWLNMPFWHSMFWVAVGKGTRYGVLILSLIGLLSFT